MMNNDNIEGLTNEHDEGVLGQQTTVDDNEQQASSPRERAIKNKKQETIVGWIIFGLNIVTMLGLFIMLVMTGWARELRSQEGQQLNQLSLMRLSSNFTDVFIFLIVTTLLMTIIASVMLPQMRKRISNLLTLGGTMITFVPTMIVWRYLWLWFDLFNAIKNRNMAKLGRFDEATFQQASESVTLANIVGCIAVALLIGAIIAHFGQIKKSKSLDNIDL